MSDYISREAASTDECKHKIKTPFARIIVEGTPEKPYYNILYFDTVDRECHIGFGSYCLDNVFNWLAEEFEIKEPCADAEPVRHGRWEEYIHSRYCGIDEYGEPIYRDGTVYYCSNPKCRRKTVIKENFCPSCGAKMDLEDETHDN